jgi:4-hydroxy-2-oxoheptanedioate aldolase
MKVEAKSRAGVARSIGCFLFVVVTGWTVWPQAAPQGPGDAPQKRQRINGIIQALEENRVADGSVKVLIEMEHGMPYDIKDMKKIFEEWAAKRKPNGQLEKTPIVRLPTRSEQTTWMVENTLDAGALGIIFPLMENKAQVLKAVSTMRIPQKRGSKYPNPPGVRGAGLFTVFAPELFSGFPLWGKMTNVEYMERADLWPLNPNGELLCVIMVETPEGLKNINDILSVPGIGAVVVGTNDLSIALGLGPSNGPMDLPPVVMVGVTTVAKAASAKKIHWGMSNGSAKNKEDMVKLGSRYPF